MAAKRLLSPLLVLTVGVVSGVYIFKCVRARSPRKSVRNKLTRVWCLLQAFAGVVQRVSSAQLARKARGAEEKLIFGVGQVYSRHVQARERRPQRPRATSPVHIPNAGQGQGREGPPAGACR